MTWGTCELLGPFRASACATVAEANEAAIVIASGEILCMCVSFAGVCVLVELEANRAAGTKQF
jgi:hypothetical protein